MSEQLTVEQKNNIEICRRYLFAASAILKIIDGQIQSYGSTGPNPINHVSFDLENTASYIDSWTIHGVDL